MLETIFSLLLLVNGTTTPLTYNCLGIATSSNCVAETATASTTLTLSVNVPVETRIVARWATTTIYATTTVEKIVYRNATSSRSTCCSYWREWERQNATTTPATTTIKYVERVVEKIKFVPVEQCPATTTPPKLHYSTTTPDYTKPPKIEKIEAKIEKQIEKMEQKQERMIDRMNNVFERMIDRLNEMLGNI